MSGRHLFDELTKDFTPERRARVEARKVGLRAAMPLHELRQARAMTQNGRRRDQPITNEHSWEGEEGEHRGSRLLR